MGAEISVIQTARTLAYTITGTELGASTADLGAVFWLPSKNAEAYVALQNTADVPISITASLITGGSPTPFSSVELGPLQSQVLTVPLDGVWKGSSEKSTRYGGIVLSHQGPEGSLNTSGWIEDEATGYSTMMTFHDPKRHTGNELYGTQILLGQQTNLLPSGRPLIVDSYLLLFNTSATDSIAPTAEFIYENQGQIVHMPITLPTIKPREVIQADLGDLQKDGIVPQTVSSGTITINYAGREGFLMGRVFGIANDPTFGFYWALESYSPFAIDEIYWTTNDDAVSLLTVANFAPKPDEITVVITYNGGSVSLPKISMQPYQSVTLNMRDLSRRGLLPPTATYGGYSIFGTPGRSKIVVKEHVISERMRTATPFYGGPPYAVYLYLSKLTTGGDCCTAPQFDLQLDETGNIHSLVHWSDGHEAFSLYDIWSNDTSIAIHPRVIKGTY